MKKYLIYVIVLIVGISVGRFLSPKEIQIKEIEKIVEVKKSSKDQIENKKETKFPNGTIITETIIETKEKEETIKDHQKEFEKIVKSIQSQWSIGLYGNKEQISATLDRRIIGGLFIGINFQSKFSLQKPDSLIGGRLEF